MRRAGRRHALEFAADHPSLVAAAGGHSTTVPRSPDDLAAAKIPIYLDVRWQPAPGAHGRPYRSAHLADYLRFYSDALAARDG
jgi:hypothetical protein